MESYNNYQNNPYGDGNNEAVKIVNALKPVIKNWDEEWNRNCIRAKQMTVKTKPNGTTVGVVDAFSSHVMNIPYTNAINTAAVGDTVWCVWMCDNMQTLVAMWMGEIMQSVTSGTCTLSSGMADGNVIWSRSGSVVTIGGYINPTAAGNQTCFRLPYASIKRGQYGVNFVAQIGSTTTCTFGALNEGADNYEVRINCGTAAVAYRFNFAYITNE